MTKPLLKWAGSKYKVLDRLLEFFPDKPRRIIEPFAGSAAVSLQFPRIRGIIADENMALVRFHAIVAGLPPSEILIQGGQLDMRYNGLETIEEKKHFYYALRDEFNAHVRDEVVSGSSDRVRTGMLLWFLNKTCFNGLWRENKKGQFNVPFGQRESLNLAGHDVEPVHKALRNKTMIHSDFGWTIRAAQPGDVIYADPPYYTEDGSFTSYSSTPFGREQHARLARELRDAHKRGVHIVASNSNTDFVRELYEWAEIHEISAPTSISRDAKSRGKRRELVIRALA